MQLKQFAKHLWKRINDHQIFEGSLGALIILMLWFYFTGIAILIGGEINSECEHHSKAVADG